METCKAVCVVFTILCIGSSYAKPVRNNTILAPNTKDFAAREFVASGPIFGHLLENSTSLEHTFIRLDTSGQHEYLPVSCNF